MNRSLALLCGSAALTYMLGGCALHYDVGLPAPTRERDASSLAALLHKYRALRGLDPEKQGMRIVGACSQLEEKVDLATAQGQHRAELASCYLFLAQAYRGMASDIERVKPDSRVSTCLHESLRCVERAGILGADPLLCAFERGRTYLALGEDNLAQQEFAFIHLEKKDFPGLKQYFQEPDE